MTFLSLKLF